MIMTGRAADGDPRGAAVVADPFTAACSPPLVRGLPAAVEILAGRHVRYVISVLFRTAHEYSITRTRTKCHILYHTCYEYFQPKLSW